MSDVANLNIKTNADKARQDIKALGNELTKTGAAGNTLIGTLKDLGMVIGLGVLIKKSIQLNNQLSAINNKFKTIFGSGSIPGMDRLINDFNMTESGAKRVLTTIGQFATGLGQSGQYVRQFSTDLAKAAADYAAWAGLPDVNEVAKKFAKATLGETGELKDIGIVIDTQSEAFKRLTAEIQSSTNASEAQAKQMAITQSILEQVGIASGSAAKQSTDLWTQAKVSFEALNEVLAKVGAIFSTLFGPVLADINAILKLPFTQWILAGGIALGSMFIMWKKISGAVKALRKSTDQLMKENQTAKKELSRFQDDYLAKLKRQEILEKKINALLEMRGALVPDPGKRVTDRDTAPGKEYSNLSTKMTPFRKSLADAQGDLASFGQEVKKSMEGIPVLAESLEGLNTQFAAWITALGLLKSAQLKTVATTYGQIAAEKLKAFTINASTDATVASTVKNAFSGIGGFFTSFFTGVTGATIATAGAWKTLAVVLGVAALKITLIIALIVSVVWIIDGLISLLRGNGFTHGYINTAAVNWYLGTEDEDKVQERLKRLKEINKNISEQYKKMAELTQQLKDMELDFKMQNAPLNTVLLQATAEFKKAQANYLRQREYTRDFSAYTRDHKFDLTGLDEAQQREKIATTRAKIALDALDAFNKMRELSDKIKQITNEINAMVDKTKQAISNITVQFTKIFTTTAYGYKNGIFGNWAKEAEMKMTTDYLAELQGKLNALNKSLYGAKTLDSAAITKNLTEQRDIYEIMFKGQQNLFKLRMEQLAQERAKTIENLNTMRNLVQEATKFRSDAVSAVSADSLQAIKLQDRREPTQDILNEYVKKISGQQAQVKDIETKMLTEQEKARTTLGTIKDNLVSLYKEVTRRQTGFTGKIDINLVNPF